MSPVLYILSDYRNIAAAAYLDIDQFRKNDFLHLGLTAIHQSYPAHKVTGFQILGGPGLHHQLGSNDGMMLFQIPQQAILAKTAVRHVNLLSSENGYKKGHPPE